MGQAGLSTEEDVRKALERGQFVKKGVSLSLTGKIKRSTY